MSLTASGAGSVLLYLQEHWTGAIAACIAAVVAAVFSLVRTFLTSAWKPINERAARWGENLAKKGIDEAELRAGRAWLAHFSGYQRKYRQDLIYRLRTYRTQGFQHSGPFTVDLENVYVPLGISPRDPRWVSGNMVAPSGSVEEAPLHDRPRGEQRRRHDRHHRPGAPPPAVPPHPPRASAATRTRRPPLRPPLQARCALRFIFDPRHHTATMRGMVIDDDITTKLLFTTVRIEGQLADGGTSVGTGFFLTTEDGGLDEMVLVTNNHVITGCESGELTVHTQPREGTPGLVRSRPFVTQITDFGSRWTPHPDEQIDLCAMPARPLRASLAPHKVDLCCRPLLTTLIPSAEQLSMLGAAEPVLMVGYPNGLWDKKNALPLLRSGLTASHPEIPFDGKPWGAVDIAAFPGSSGSPIVRIGDQHSATMTYRSQKLGPCLLLGALWGGPLFDSEGEVEVAPAPTFSTAKAYMELPMHLGYYVRSDQFPALLDVVK